MLWFFWVKKRSGNGRLCWPIAKELKDALQGKPNMFHDLLRLVVSYEKGFWEELPVYARKLSVREGDFPEMYMDAVTWSHKML